MWALSSLKEPDILRQDIPVAKDSRVTLLMKLCDMIEYRRKPKPSEIELNQNRRIRHQAVVQLVKQMYKSTDNKKFIQ